MAIPSEPKPEFANGGDATYTEPGSGKKSLGWVAGEIPPSSYFNWLHRTTYRWINYLANVLGGSDGDFQLKSGRTVDDEAPFVVNGAPQTKWKKALESRAAAAGINRFGRLYTSADNSGMIFVLNAGWNPSTELWQLSTASRPAIALILEEGGVRVVAKAASASPWDDDHWDSPAALLSTGNLGTYGDLAANGDLIVGTDATIGGNLDVTGNLHGVGGTLTIDGDCTITDDLTITDTLIVGGAARFNNTLRLGSGSVPFIYDSVATGRTAVYDLREGHITGSVSYNTGGYMECTSGGVGVISLTVPVPRSCTITGASVYAVTPGSETVSLELFRESVNMTPGSGAWTAESMMSGGALSVPGAGSVLVAADQNSTLTGNQRCTVIVTLQEGARVRHHVHVVYSAIKPTAYDL